MGEKGNFQESVRGKFNFICCSWFLQGIKEETLLDLDLGLKNSMVS